MLVESMGDKVLSDILLFKQLDEASRRDPIKDDERVVEGKKKKVVVVKKNVIQESLLPDIVDTPISSPTKKVVVARKVKLGDTTLPPLVKTDSNSAVSHSIITQDGTIPLSIISQKKRGPKYDLENKVIERSILGSAEEYLSWKPSGVPESTTRTPRSPSPPSRLFSSSTTISTPTERPRTAVDADEFIDIMSRMSIHEKIRYLKEERALQRWERTVAEWERIKRGMASKTGRDIDRVALTRSERFRAVMEQKELIERALATKDLEMNDLFATSLMPVGSKDKGLFMEMRPPSREPMEVIGKPGMSRSRPSSSYYSSRKLELQDSVNMIAPYEPDINGLSIVGTPIGRPMEPPNFSSLSNFPTLAGMTSADFQNPSIASLSTYVHPPSTIDGWTDNSPMSTPSAQRYRGPKVLFEGMHAHTQAQDAQDLRVVCEVAVGGLARAVLHAHNVGSTAIYYQWRKLERERVFQVKEETDTTQRFYFHDIKGVMLPAETRSFIFGFKSDNHGIFFEKWVFESSPTLSTPGPTLTLKGIAIQEDDTAEARYQLEEAIGAKQINHGVQDIIRSIIENIKPVVKPIPPLEDLDAEQELFLLQNRDLHLYYSTELCKAFQLLARSTYDILFPNEDKKWDLSVMNLHEEIQCINDDRQRSDFLAELNSLIEQSSVPRHVSSSDYSTSIKSGYTKPAYHTQSIYYCMAYDLLVQLADRIPVLSSSLRESMTLPAVSFVPAEDDILRKVDSFGNILDISKQRVKDASKKKGGSRRKLAESPDKRQESPPRKKKEKAKDEDSDKEDERHKSPVKKRLSRTRTREREKTGDVPKEKEKEEKTHLIKESIAVSSSRRLKKKKAEGGDDEKKDEEEEEWSNERKTKEADYKAELYSKVRELVIDTFVRYRQLAQEADAVSRRYSQELFFETVAATDPEPVDKLLEGEFAPPEEREERIGGGGGEEEMDDAHSVSLSIPRTSSAITNEGLGLDSERALDARARRRRRVLNRK